MKYNFTDITGTERAMTLTEIHRGSFPKRSRQWVKAGLDDGARDVLSMVRAGDVRIAQGLHKAKMAAKKNPFSRKVGT